MKLRSEIKILARQNFTAQYGICIATLIVFSVLSSAASAITFGLGVFFLMPPLVVGFSAFSLSIYRGQRGDISEMFEKGFSDYWNKVAGMLLCWIYTLLWTLLFIIPGIIKALAYSMTPYILAETNVEASEAIRISQRMTDGYKGEIFVMILSFIGWWILCALTFGLLYLLYTGPYFHTTFAGFYEELKANAIASGRVRVEELA